MKKKTKKRIILGVGYPWYSRSSFGISHNRYSHISLTKLRSGRGDDVLLYLGNSGAWKKYKLVLEEL